MKKKSFTMKVSISILFLFLHSICLNAQSDSTSCHTIILLNDKEIPATIDSIFSGFIFYHKCPDTIGRQFSISMKAVASVEAPLGKGLMLPPGITNNLGMKIPRANTWKFKHKTRRKVGVISKGQTVAVHYKRNKYISQNAWGSWHDLTEDAVLVHTREQGIVSIPKEKVMKIRVYPFETKRKVGKFVLGTVLLFVGAVMLGTLVLGGLYLSTLYGSSVFSSPIFILAGLMSVTFLFGGIKTISKANPIQEINWPFKDKWEIVSPPAEQEATHFLNGA